MESVRKCYAILYKGLEHLQILVSVVGLGTNPLWIPRDNCNDNNITRIC